MVLLNFIWKVNNLWTFKLKQEILSIIIVKSMGDIWQGTAQAKKWLLPGRNPFFGPSQKHYHINKESSLAENHHRWFSEFVIQQVKINKSKCIINFTQSTNQENIIHNFSSNWVKKRFSMYMITSWAVDCVILTTCIFSPLFNSIFIICSFFYSAIYMTD